MASEQAAQKFLETRLEPDPNHPGEDVCILHFPNGCESVEGREFWMRNLAEMLAAFAESLKAQSQDGGRK